jgi:hypothetical protein
MGNDDSSPQVLLDANSVGGHGWPAEAEHPFTMLLLVLLLLLLLLTNEG